MTLGIYQGMDKSMRCKRDADSLKLVDNYRNAQGFLRYLQEVSDGITVSQYQQLKALALAGEIEIAYKWLKYYLGGGRENVKNLTFTQQAAFDLWMRRIQHTGEFAEENGMGGC